MRFIYILFLAVTLVGCGTKTDSEKTAWIINNLATHIKQADGLLNKSFNVVQSVAGGRPPYEASDMINPHLENLEYHLSSIALLHENDAANVDDEKLRKDLKKGINEIWEVYNARIKFVRISESSLRSGNIKKLVEAGKLFADAQGELNLKMMTAMAYVISAKKIAGLPEGLSEFK